MLGPSWFPVYLLNFQKKVLIDAGLICLGQRYVQELQKILGNDEPDLCLLTHVHFDHCGGVPVFKKAFPNMRVCGCELSQEILKRHRAVQLIQDLNQNAGDSFLKEMEGVNPNEKFEPFAIDQILKDGDTLTLSPGITLKVMATPGHTRDSLSYFIPEKSLLFCSEAAGVPDASGYVITDALVDFDQYLSSLHRLSLLDAEIVCLGHNSVYIGDDARSYFSRSLDHAYAFKDLVKKCLIKEDGDKSRVIQRIKAKEYDPLPNPKQIEEAYTLNLQARISAVEKSKNYHK